LPITDPFAIRTTRRAQTGFAKPLVVRSGARELGVQHPASFDKLVAVVIGGNDVHDQLIAPCWVTTVWLDHAVPQVEGAA
jgi:hypothetical protein